MRKPTVVYTLLVFILLIGAFFRFYLITEIPPGLYPDEAMNGNNALEAFSGAKNFDISIFRNFKVFYPENNGREGLFINLQALSIWFFGNEPWALRLVSAVFGLLTILSVYLLSRELFSSKISKSEALISKQSQNPNDSKSFRDSRLEIRDYRGEYIALLSTFFLATSYWHVNFSRIGFRAIMVPFLATFGLYFLLKGLRKGTISDLVWAGVFIGLGFHTYIAFRFMPFVFLVPLCWYLWRWWKSQTMNHESGIKNYGNVQENHDSLFMIPDSNKCIPCAILLFLFVTFIVALPIGLYFLQNPQDFVGRGGQVSVFAAESPLYEFAKSNFLTLQMLFWRGDCNWRHNYACRPELDPLVMPFFALGFFVAVISVIKPTRNFQITNHNFQTNLNDQNFNNQTRRVWNLKNWKLFGNWKLEIGNSQAKLSYLTLLVWLAVMSLPATLTREGLPHALRAIGVIPPVMIMSGLGAWRFMQWILGWFDVQKIKWPDSARGISRIQKEIGGLFMLVLLLVPLAAYRNYFLDWAYYRETYFAFSTDLLHIGQYLDGLPEKTKKYVLVNQSGVEVRGIPMPAQTVMFATDTFRAERQNERSIIYTTDVETIAVVPGEPTIITMLNGLDRDAIRRLKEKFPDLIEKAPADFIVFQNY